MVAINAIILVIMKVMERGRTCPPFSFVGPDSSQ